MNKLRVLVVDDDPNGLERITQLLASFDVVGAETEHKAWAEVEANPDFSVIVYDRSVSEPDPRISMASTLAHYYKQKNLSNPKAVLVCDGNESAQEAFPSGLIFYRAVVYRTKLGNLPEIISWLIQ